MQNLSAIHGPRPRARNIAWAGCAVSTGPGLWQGTFAGTGPAKCRLGVLQRAPLGQLPDAFAICATCLRVLQRARLPLACITHRCCRGNVSGPEKGTAWTFPARCVRHLCYLFAGPAEGPACSCMHHAPVLQRVGFNPAKMSALTLTINTFAICATCCRVLHRARHAAACIVHRCCRGLGFGPAKTSAWTLTRNTFACFRVLQRAPLGHLPKCVRHLRYMFVGPAEGPSRSCMHHRAWVLHRAPLGHDRIC